MDPQFSTSTNIIGKNVPNHKLMHCLLYGMDSSSQIPVQKQSCDGFLEKHCRNDIQGSSRKRTFKTISTQTENSPREPVSKHRHSSSEICFNKSPNNMPGTSDNRHVSRWSHWKCGDCGAKIFSGKVNGHTKKWVEKHNPNEGSFVKKQVEKLDPNLNNSPFSYLEGTRYQAQNACVNIMTTMRDKIVQQDNGCCICGDGSDWSDYSDNIDNKHMHFPKETRNAMSLLMDGIAWPTPNTRPRNPPRDITDINQIQYPPPPMPDQRRNKLSN